MSIMASSMCSSLYVWSWIMDFLPHKCTHTYPKKKESNLMNNAFAQQQLAKEAIMEWLKIQWNLANVLIPNTRKEKKEGEKGKNQTLLLRIVFPSIVATKGQLI